MRHKVRSYYRSIKGKRHKVRKHMRNSIKRHDYNIKRKRQLSGKVNPIDMSLKARKPGKRLSEEKKRYYERRFNRSDKGTWI